MPLSIALEHCGVQYGMANFGIENGVPAETSWIGQNYIAVLTNACGGGDHGASEILQGMLAVFNAEITCFYYEYPCHSPSKHRWFTMRVCKLNGNNLDDYYVISHHDVTQRKLAEERAEALSLQDPLTGLGNRRQFDASLKQEIRNSMRDQTLIVWRSSMWITLRILMTNSAIAQVTNAYAKLVKCCKRMRADPVTSRCVSAGMNLR